MSITSTCSSSYDAAENWIHEAVKSGHPLFFCPTIFADALADAAHQFSMPVESLSSFLRSIHLVHVKRNAHMLRNNVKRHVENYVRGSRILDMARAMNYPPYHVARLIVENVANLTTGSSGEGGRNPAGSASSSGNKKAVTGAMREPQRVLGDPSILKPEYRSSEENGSSSSPPISRLATEVIEAMRSDPLYGPKQDRERQSVGLEHEEMLEKALEAMDIPFETENDLRIKGTARTPDVLLSTPVGMKVPKRSSTSRKLLLDGNEEHFAKGNVGEDDDEEEYEWKVVCWIDSKAMFGDVQTHNSSVLPQAESFVHRFGPGLILYWFGHAPVDRLGDGHGDVLVTGWKLPDEFMLPTGELATAQDVCRGRRIDREFAKMQDE